MSAEPFTSVKEINEQFHKCFHVMSAPWSIHRTAFWKKNIDLTGLENHPVNLLLSRNSDTNAKAPSAVTV